MPHYSKGPGRDLVLLLRVSGKLCTQCAMFVCVFVCVDVFVLLNYGLGGNIYQIPTLN